MRLAAELVELGCWAHARRKFFDAHKASGSPVAEEALQHIGALYAIEATLRELKSEARGLERQRRLVPKLDALKRWLDELQPKVLGNTALDKASELHLEALERACLCRHRAFGWLIVACQVGLIQSFPRLGIKF